jgi:hypothetical protein
MTDDDIERVRELAESVIRAAKQRQEAAYDPAIDWTDYDRIAQNAVDQQEALVERVDARTLLALISRLEAAEQERDTLTALARAVATGYAGSVMVGGDCGAVTLHYTTSAQAEAAHAALTDYIDALAAEEQST